MRRRDISDSELAQVIRLRQVGASWLKIQERTGIPRRSAKRAYENWQRSQSLEDLKAARLNVATEEFREHIDSLIKLAWSLAICLDVPQSPDVTMSAEQFLDDLWERDIFRELELYQRPRGENREKQFMLRQHRLLLKSLQDHTPDEVQWDILDKWKRDWDYCLEVFAKFKVEARQVIKNILNQDTGLLEKIKQASGEKNPDKRMAEAGLNTIWQRILNDKLDSKRPVVHTISRDDGVTLLTLIDFSDNVVLSFSDANIAERAADVCNWAARNLCIGDKSDMVKSLINNVHEMRKSTKEIAEMLNPLILRPVILRTKCELCPA